MLYKIENFENKTPSDINFEETTLSCGEHIKIYEITTVHDLTQFIGYGKYMNNQQHSVYLRGQTELYNGTLIPSLYRNRNRIDSITTKYNYRINKLKAEINSFTQYDKIVLEPLLQHYGIKTPYLDLIDNVWIALWFALHQTKCEIINSHEYIYFFTNTYEYSYILLIVIIPHQETQIPLRIGSTRFPNDAIGSQNRFTLTFA